MPLSDRDRRKAERALEKQTRMLSIHERPEEKNASFDLVTRGLRTAHEPMVCFTCDSPIKKGDRYVPNGPTCTACLNG